MKEKAQLWISVDWEVKKGDRIIVQTEMKSGTRLHTVVEIVPNDLVLQAVVLLATVEKDEHERTDAD